MENYWKELMFWTSSFVTKEKNFYLVIPGFFFILLGIFCPLIILITNSSYSRPIQQTITYGLAIIFAIVFVSLLLCINGPYKKTKNNWRLAVDEARKFGRKHPQYQKEINQLILAASKYRRSQDIMDWLEAWKEYQKEKEELELMEARRQQLPETISRMETELVNLPSQIEKQKTKVKELEQWLSGEEDGE